MLRGPDDPLIDFTIDDAVVGDDVMTGSTVEARVHVTGGDGSFVQLWRDGAKITQQPVTGADTTVTLTDEPGEGTYRYRVEVMNDLNQRVVVTSHIYATVEPASGCGCRSSRGSGGVVLIALASLLATRRRAR
jgi:MYXO-CTERM domain-containing protein